MIVLSAKAVGLEAFAKSLPKIQQAIVDAGYFAAIDSGDKAREKVKSEMQDVFDRPTPFILRSLRLTNAKGGAVGKNVAVRGPGGKVIRRERQTDFNVHLGYVDVFAEGGYDPVNDVVSPHVEGERRRAKPSEIKLRQAGAIRGDEYLVAAKGAPLNRYGNVAPAAYKKMLTDLRGAGSSESSSKTRRGGGKGRYIVIDTGGHKGIYRTSGGYGASAVRNAQLIWHVTKRAPSYSKVLPFYKIAEEEYRRVYLAEYDRALARRLKKVA